MPTSIEGEQPSSSTPSCPRCGGEMWDNRVGKRNPRAPDFKCKDRSCDAAIWPPRSASAAAPERSTPGPAQSPPSAGSRRAAVDARDADGLPLCPHCGGAMWDDRLSKRNPRAPDFRCRNRPRERGGEGCAGVIWPPRDGSPSPYPEPVPRRPPRESAGPPPDAPPPDAPPPDLDADELPF